MVRAGLVIAWRLATSPTRTSPDFEKPTTDGVVRAPSALGMTVGSPASRTLTTELVVPRSMPTALGIGGPPCSLGIEILNDRQCSKVERDGLKNPMGPCFPGARRAPSVGSTGVATLVLL